MSITREQRLAITKRKVIYKKDAKDESYTQETDELKDAKAVNEWTAEINKISSNSTFQFDGGDEFKGYSLEACSDAVGGWEIIGARMFYKFTEVGGQQDSMTFGELEIPSGTNLPNYCRNEIQKIASDLKENVESKILAKGGSTFTSAILDLEKKQITSNNLGDGTIFVYDAKTNTIKQLNELDRQEEPHEKKRLNGKKISLGTSAGFGNFDVPQFRRTPRVKTPVTYAEGDLLIVACDGITEQKSMTLEKIGEIIQKNKGLSPKKIAQLLTGQAYTSTSMDNLSCLVVDPAKLLDFANRNNTKKVFEFTVCDGHGKNAHLISQRICAQREQTYEQAYTVNNKKSTAWWPTVRPFVYGIAAAFFVVSLFFGVGGILAGAGVIGWVTYMAITGSTMGIASLAAASVAVGAGTAWYKRRQTTASLKKSKSSTAVGINPSHKIITATLPATTPITPKEETFSPEYKEEKPPVASQPKDIVSSLKENITDSYEGVLLALQTFLKAAEELESSHNQELKASKNQQTLTSNFKSNVEELFNNINEIYGFIKKTFKESHAQFFTRAYHSNPLDIEIILLQQQIEKVKAHISKPTP